MWKMVFIFMRGKTVDRIKQAKKPITVARKLLSSEEKVVHAYKLMKVDEEGKLHFPFANTGKWVKLGRWMEAEDASSIGKDGKRRTTLIFRGGGKGRMAPRPGFHCSDKPYAPHIGVKGTQKQHDFIGNEDVWCECTLKAEIDYQEEANRNGLTQSGKINHQKADIRDRVPTNGTYRYKTNPNMRGTWIIGGTMRIDRIMYDDEVRAITDAEGYKPMPRDGGDKPREWTDWLNNVNL